MLDKAPDLPPKPEEESNNEPPVRCIVFQRTNRIEGMWPVSLLTVRRETRLEREDTDNQKNQGDESDSSNCPAESKLVHETREHDRKHDT